MSSTAAAAPQQLHVVDYCIDCKRRFKYGEEYHTIDNPVNPSVMLAGPFCSTCYDKLAKQPERLANFIAH